MHGGHMTLSDIITSYCALRVVYKCLILGLTNEKRGDVMLLCSHWSIQRWTIHVIVKRPAKHGTYRTYCYVHTRTILVRRKGSGNSVYIDI